MKPLDSFSRRILQFLQADSRCSLQEIAEKVGLSATPCWRRIKEMEEAQVIRRYTVVLDRAKLGLGLCVFAHVQLLRHNEDATVRFETAIAACPEIVECARVSGDADYMLKVIVADVGTYDNFLHGTLFPLGVVANVRSSIVLRHVKENAEIAV